MDKIPIGSIVPHLAALRPTARCSEIILCDGTVLEDCRRIRSLVTALARHYAVDLVALRQLCGQMLHRRNYLPLPLAAGLLLVPLPMAESPERVGYVNYLCIESTGKKDTPWLKLTGGAEINCFLSKATLANRLLAARYAGMAWKNCRY